MGSCKTRSTQSSSALARRNAQRQARRTTALVSFALIVIALGVSAFLDAALALALISLFALVTAFFGVVWQVRDNRAHARRELSYSYYERWNSSHMLACRVVFGQLLDLHETTVEDRWREWSEGSRLWTLERRLKANVVFNFFEELGGQYNRGTLDTAATAEYLGSQALEVWRRSEWLIGRHRKKDATTCIEWKRMLDAIDAPLKRRARAGERAAQHLTPEQAAALDFTPPPLVLAPTDGDEGWLSLERWPMLAE
jgi:hypothetical protein